MSNTKEVNKCSKCYINGRPQYLKDMVCEYCPFSELSLKDSSISIVFKEPFSEKEFQTKPFKDFLNIDGRNQVVLKQ